jgi:hypothetical protein
MAGAGYRTWTAGEVVTASNVQSYLQDQTVGVYAGTAARSSAILSPSEGQVSYRTDDDVVEVYNGTGWVPVAPADTAGLVHINTTSFSAVASQSINDVFSATYDNYRIIMNQVGTGVGQLRFRYRVSGADNSVTNYRQQVVGGDGASAFAGRDSGLSFHLPGRTMNGEQTSSIVDVINPFSSTLRAQQFTNYNDLTTGNIVLGLLASQLDVTTSYTGFTIFPENGTITGSVSVYAYAK